MPTVDISNYSGREQAFVKHRLLENYLSRWAYIVGNTWDSLVYVAGFAGPWGAQDEEFRDASFGIATNVLKTAVDGLLEKTKKSVKGLCVFVEKDTNAFDKLFAFANKCSTNEVQAIALKGEFVENIPEIEKRIRSTGANPFKFVFLDQKGWAETPMKDLKPFLQERSCEVLFNLMTSHLTRFVNLEGTKSSYESLFGRTGVREKIASAPSDLRGDVTVKEYCVSLRKVCGFKYVSQAVIMDPNKEKVRYYLIFATNSPRGIEVFKEAESTAANIQDEVRHQIRLEQEIKKTGQNFLFDLEASKSKRVSQLWIRYSADARKRIIELLRESKTERVSYTELFCEAMSFPLVTSEDLISWLHELEPAVKFDLEGSSRRNKPSLWKADFIVLIDRTKLPSP